MGVPSYTTPCISLTFTGDIDLTQADNVFVTFACNGRIITKTGAALTVEEKQISVGLTQEETSFLTGEVKLQANWMLAGKRIASDVATLYMTDQLLTEVIS